MQQQMMRQEGILEELNKAKVQLSSTERERDCAVNKVKEIKSQMNDAEVNSLKENLQNAEKELQVKDNVIESREYEADKVKQLELKLSEKEATLQNVKDEANNFKSSLAQTEGFLSDSKKEVDRLAVEMGQKKISEDKMSESFAAQTGQIEQLSILLERSELQITSLEEKMRDLVQESERKDRQAREEIERLKNEILVHEENAHHTNERYKKSESSRIKNLLDEIGILKDELKQAMEAEDASKRDMDDLAVALKEVATESNQVKEKLILTEQQLQTAKEEVGKSKMMLKSKEETYETLMKELKKENDQLNNTIHRLRLEAEESLLAFNDREVQFVKCIKSTEEEKNSAQEEFNRLVKPLREAEEISYKSKEENKKLRDILKQALNEANVAKEAASLAKEENYCLKDSLAEKDKALVTLAQEIERLRINEAEANESIKELKRVIMSGSKKEVAKLERENKEQKKEEHARELKKEKEQKKVTKIVTSGENSEKDSREGRRFINMFNFDLEQLLPSISSTTWKSIKDFDEDALGGSIFDLVESPTKGLSHCHHQTASASSSEDNLNSDQFDEDAHFDDMEIDRTSPGKRKALLRRFGDLLRRKNSHPQPHQPKEVVHLLKEIPA